MSATTAWEDSIVAVRNEIRTLTLSALFTNMTTQVVAPSEIRTLDDPDIPLPRVVCAIGDVERHNPNDGGNLSNYVGYPVVVAYLAKGNQGRGADAPTRADVLEDRAKIADAFANKTLSAVTLNMKCEVQYLTAAAPNMWFDYSLFVGGLIIWCKTYLLKS